MAWHSFWFYASWRHFLSVLFFFEQDATAAAMNHIPDFHKSIKDAQTQDQAIYNDLLAIRPPLSRVSGLRNVVKSLLGVASKASWAFPAHVNALLRDGCAAFPDLEATLERFAATCLHKVQTLQKTVGHLERESLQTLKEVDSLRVQLQHSQTLAARRLLSFSLFTACRLLREGKLKRSIMPAGRVTMVATYVFEIAEIWRNDEITGALELMVQEFEKSLAECKGFNAWDDGFGNHLMVFKEAADAILWCCQVQTNLLKIDWPARLLQENSCKPVYKKNGDLILNGLRLKMGIHTGIPDTQWKGKGGSMYSGPRVVETESIAGMASMGEILMSQATFADVTKFASPEVTQKLHDGNIAWLQRDGECMVVDGTASTLHIVYSTALMPRRGFLLSQTADKRLQIYQGKLTLSSRLGNLSVPEGGGVGLYSKQGKKEPLHVEPMSVHQRTAAIVHSLASAFDLDTKGHELVDLLTQVLAKVQLLKAQVAALEEGTSRRHGSPGSAAAASERGTDGRPPSSDPETNEKVDKELMLLSLQPLAHLGSFSLTARVLAGFDKATRDLMAQGPEQTGSSCWFCRRHTDADVRGAPSDERWRLPSPSSPSKTTPRSEDGKQDTPRDLVPRPDDVCARCGSSKSPREPKSPGTPPSWGLSKGILRTGKSKKQVRFGREHQLRLRTADCETSDIDWGDSADASSASPASGEAFPRVTSPTVPPSAAPGSPPTPTKSGDFDTAVPDDDLVAPQDPPSPQAGTGPDAPPVAPAADTGAEIPPEAIVEECTEGDTASKSSSSPLEPVEAGAWPQEELNGGEVLPWQNSTTVSVSAVMAHPVPDGPAGKAPDKGREHSPGGTPRSQPQGGTPRSQPQGGTPRSQPQQGPFLHHRNSVGPDPPEPTSEEGDGKPLSRGGSGAQLTRRRRPPRRQGSGLRLAESSLAVEEDELEAAPATEPLCTEEDRGATPVPASPTASASASSISNAEPATPPAARKLLSPKVRRISNATDSSRMTSFKEKMRRIKAEQKKKQAALEEEYATISQLMQPPATSADYSHLQTMHGGGGIMKVSVKGHNAIQRQREGRSQRVTSVLDSAAGFDL